MNNGWQKQDEQAEMSDEQWVAKAKTKQAETTEHDWK